MSARKTWADKRAEILGRSGAGGAYEAARIRYEQGRREQPARFGHSADAVESAVETPT